jgi:hemerythrin-like domain-containing protein
MENVMTTASSNPRSNPSRNAVFNALDDCHRKIQEHLNVLQRIAAHMENSGLDDADRKLAGEIERFFSHTSRDHHAQEERTVFPPLLANGSEELRAAVRSLQQDHGFIEENWIELAPQLRAIAEGNNWFEVAEYQHNVALFLELMNGHIALEESLIYPESKAIWAEAISKRQTRH